MKIQLSKCKNDDNRRYWILTLFTRKIDFHIAFVPFSWYDFYYEKEGRRFIEREIRYCFALGIIQFIILDKTGIDKIHIIVDEEKEYTPLNMKRKVDAFKKYLRESAESNRKIPFEGNYAIKLNGSMIFYLTIKQDILITNQLGLFCTYRFPDVWMSKNDISYYFDKRKRKCLNKIDYKKIDNYEI